MKIKVVLEIEFYIFHNDIEYVINLIKSMTKYNIVIKKEDDLRQYEICSEVLGVKYSVDFVVEMQYILDSIDKVYALPYYDKNFAPNGMHINLVSGTSVSKEYIYSLAEFLCLNIEKKTLRKAIPISDFNFLNKDYMQHLKLLKLVQSRFNSHSLYVPKSISFANRFNRTAAFRVVKNSVKGYRIECRLPFLYCKYHEVISFLCNVIVQFCDRKLFKSNIYKYLNNSKIKNTFLEY